MRRLEPGEADALEQRGRELAEQAAAKRAPAAPLSVQGRAAHTRLEEMTGMVVHDIARITGLTLVCRVITYREWMVEDDTSPSHWRSLAMAEKEGRLDNEDEPDTADTDDRADALVVELQLEGNVHSWSVASVWNDEERVVAIADRAQDMVIHELWTAWPVCEGHEHPLRPTVSDGGAFWSCPTTNRPAVLIGALGGSEGLVDRS